MEIDNSFVGRSPTDHGTPIAQTIEKAKSELKSGDSKVIRGRKRMGYDDTIFKKDI